MAKHEKTLQKLMARPTPSDVTWSEVTALMKHLGYEELRNDGSRRKFVHRQTRHCISLHKPHPQPIMKTYIIRAIVDALIAQGLI